VSAKTSASALWKAALVLLLTLILTPLYFLYMWRGEFFLFWLSGGIQTRGGWTQFGGIDVAWTTPLELGPTLIMKYLNFKQAVLILPAIYIAVAYALASLVVEFWSNRSFAWRRHRWKALFIGLGLVWIPVPVEWALVYYYTVLY
jgi:hypothetical protein